VPLESKYEAESTGRLPCGIKRWRISINTSGANEVVVVCESLLYGLPQQHPPQFASLMLIAVDDGLAVWLDMDILRVSWLFIVDGTIRLNELHLCAGNILCCLSSIFVDGSCAKLQCVDPSFLCHLILQQGIDHSMSCGLRLGFESVRSYNDSEMGLL